MKRYYTILFFMAALCSFALRTGVSAEEPARDIIMRAMKDEMKRNIERLSIEGMARPFFISYSIDDVASLEIVASLGSIVSSDENRNRTHSVRVMVNDYALNDENFEGMGSYRSSMIMGMTDIPLENDYEGIRRALWVATDDTYKRAAELFEHKKAALAQQTESERSGIDDFSRAPVVYYDGGAADLKIDTARWENTAASLSRVFADYPDIYTSQVRIFIFSGTSYFVNTEGTEVVTPLTLASVQVNAYTQALDGEPLSDHEAWYRSTTGELPSEKDMTAGVKQMADNLVRLRSVPVYDDSYFGPVLFEGEAVAEFFSQRLFSGRESLYARRRPVTENTGYGYREDEETFEDRLGRRIFSREISIVDRPSLDRRDGMTLLGSYTIDREGVKPPSELVLVDNGILKTLLNNRTPTLKIKDSNGHFRPVVGGGAWISTATAPGVVEVTSSKTKSRADLKKELIKRAKDEGLDYGIIVSKLMPMTTGAQYYDPMVRMTTSFGKGDGGSLTAPVLVYRVSVRDGSEELVRSVSLGTVGLTALRHIVGAGDNRLTVNMLTAANWTSGVPATFIVPDALLLEELDVRKEKRDYTPRLPVVPSPLSAK